MLQLVQVDPAASVPRVTYLKEETRWEREARSGSVEEGCPAGKPGPRGRHVKRQSQNTIANARYLLDRHVCASLGVLWVERTGTDRLEEVFVATADRGYATSTIDHA